MWKIPVVAATLLLLGATCSTEPCNRYVDYMCNCHAQDTGFDCEALRQVYSSADPSLQDQCSIDLSQQKTEDEQNGVTCTLDSGGA